jgi:hypothetical protein
MGETISVGNLEFFVEMRSGATDGGPSLQVRSEIDGRRVQLLRFDMFRVQPHYHYDPNGRDIRYNLDPLTVDDGIDWALWLLGGKLEQMIAKAGYEGLLSEDTVNAVQQALPEIETRWRVVSEEPAATPS